MQPIKVVCFNISDPRFTDDETWERLKHASLVGFGNSCTALPSGVMFIGDSVAVIFADFGLFCEIPVEHILVVLTRNACEKGGYIHPGPLDTDLDFENCRNCIVKAISETLNNPAKPTLNQQ